MKILFLSHRFFPDVGGIEVNSELLAGQFTQAGHEVRLATWSSYDYEDEFSYQIFRRPSIRQLVELHQWADVVFENNICLRLSWPSLLLRKRPVVALRTWITRTNGRLAIQDKLKIRWLSRCRGVIAVSASVRDRCWPDATVIGNPYREDLFKISKTVDRQRDFAFLGRLVSDKGVVMALQALERLNKTRKRESRLTLTIIGDGPDRERLELECERLGIVSQVEFTGTLQGLKLVNQLNRHKFLWVPSIWEEPFGNVALEGMACGCIPIVSDGGGLPDAIGKAGITFERNNLSDMISQTERLICDKSFQARLAEEAKHHLFSHRPQNVAQRYLEFIEGSIET